MDKEVALLNARVAQAQAEALQQTSEKFLMYGYAREYRPLPEQGVQCKSRTRVNLVYVKDCILELRLQSCLLLCSYLSVRKIVPGVHN